MGGKLHCLCCGESTIEERSAFEICPICWWEDDDLQTDDPTFAGGANVVSLEQSKRDYEESGANNLESARTGQPRPKKVSK